MTTETNKARVLALIAAANRGDVDAIRACFSPDYRDHVEGGSRTGSDRDAAVAAFREILTAFPDSEHEVLLLLAEGDHVVLRTRASGRHDAPYRGIPPRGTVVTMTTTVIYRLLDGRIVERWCDGASAIHEQLPSTATDRVPQLLGESAPWVNDVPGARFKEVALDHVSFTVFELEPGTAFPEHRHENEQITHVIEGQLDFFVAGVRYPVGAGETVAIPSGTPHEVRAGSHRVVAVDAWSPPPEHLG
ncbi:MAG: ester cyclase [Gemmatimonadota bacterium]